MGFIKNIAAILTGGVALLFIKIALRHLIAHDVARPIERVIIDFVMAAVFGYCSYALFLSAKAHARRLMQKQEQEQASRESIPPAV